MFLSGTGTRDKRVKSTVRVENGGQRVTDGLQLVDGHRAGRATSRPVSERSRPGFGARGKSRRTPVGNRHYKNAGVFRGTREFLSAERLRDYDAVTSVISRH